MQRKCDSIFQIVFSLVHNGQKKTPVHVSISQTIHEVCRSKELIRIFIVWDYVKAMMKLKSFTVT